MNSAPQGYSSDDPERENQLRVVEVTKPGLIRMDAGSYLRDPVPGGSVSSTALKILHERSPAHARHYLDHGRKSKDHYDTGSAVHAIVLGEGRELAVWTGKTWQGDEAKVFKAAAYANDRVPVLAKDMDEEHGGVIPGMVRAVRQHPLLSRLLESGRFTGEQAAFWIDPETGLWCRAMYDAVPHFSRIMTIVDLKTTTDASPDAISRWVLNFRYDMQAVHYSDGARVLRDQGLLDFDQLQYLLAFVEKDPPHVISVRPIGERTAAFAAEHRREALRMYRDCKESGIWPGYDGRPLDGDPTDEDYDLEPIEVPYWALRNWENR
jgi:hypothetical protein